MSSVIDKLQFSPVLLLQLLGEQCNRQWEIHSAGDVANARIAVPSRTRGYLLFCCCNCWVSSVNNKQRLSPVLLLQLPGEQCSQQTVIHSGAVVSTTRIPVPSSARGYTMYSCCNSCLSSVINKKRLSLLPKLQMPGEQCNQHQRFILVGLLQLPG